MKKKAFGGGAAFALFLAIAWTSVLAIPDCGFAGTVTVHGQAVSGGQVAAYLSDNLSQQVGIGASSPAGYGIGISGANGKDVTFKVSGLFVDQPDQMCTDPTLIKTLNLTVSDGDRDGYNYTVDCNDSNPSIYPGATEICGNGIDEDCSGADLACPPSGGGSPGSSGGSSGGGGGGGFSCTTNWTCSDWSACSGNVQTRSCSDANSCGINSSRPAESQACTALCTEGTNVCAGNDLMACVGGTWAKTETCQYGCQGDKCLEGPGAEETNTVPSGQQGAPLVQSFFEPSSWPYWIIIIIVIALAAWHLMRRRKKNKK